jgi:methionyl-tRNA formyltransferase
MIKTLLIIGHDKIGRETVKDLEKSGMTNTHNIIWDKSSSLARVFKLVRKGILPISLIVKMILAEAKRKSVKLSNNYQSISSRNELMEFIEKDDVEFVILFRAGLIINSKLLKSPTRFLNIHASKLPEYGGLGTIQKAIDDQAWNQCVTLHEVEIKIDSGRTLDTEPYIISKDLSYYQSEEIAYASGRILLKRALNSLSDSKMSLNYLKE